MLRSLLAAPMFAALLSAPSAQTCQPAPVVVLGPGMALNSTYVNDGEPPKRFAHVPSGEVRIRFGQANLDAICGVPPCGLVFEGCTHGNLVVLPDPYKVNNEQFARIARHELAHVAGWPASHGV
jgi:hypothetical protein